MRGRVLPISVNVVSLKSFWWISSNLARCPLGHKDPNSRSQWLHVGSILMNCTNVHLQNEDKIPFYIQKVKGQLHSELIMLCRNTFLAIIQRQNFRTKTIVIYISHLIKISDTKLWFPPWNCTDCLDLLHSWVEDVCVWSISISKFAASVQHHSYLKLCAPPQAHWFSWY